VHDIFREGLLEGRLIGLAPPGRTALGDRLRGLGAEVRDVEADPADEPAATAAAGALGDVDALVVDAAALFVAGDGRAAATGAGRAPEGAADELAPLRAAADGAWVAVRAVANAAWIAPRRPGRIVLLAPAPGDGAHAEAARAALENLARTLSIEWSRFGIRTVAITPGATTPAADVASLVAYLASPGGDYFSGARLDLV
jgi:citronellol/citronellal dehydrogenase